MVVSNVLSTVSGTDEIFYRLNNLITFQPTLKI